jgi:hypothetical protein
MGKIDMAVGGGFKRPPLPFPDGAQEFKIRKAPR